MDDFLDLSEIKQEGIDIQMEFNVSEQ